jgi:cobaltochelatase CobT
MPRIVDFYSRCQNNDKKELKEHHNVVEDIWMERKVMYEYPGSIKNLHQVQELARSKEYKTITSDPKIVEERLSTLTHDSADLGMLSSKPDFLTEDSYGQKLRDILPEDVLKHTDHWTKLASEIDNSEDAISLAKAIYKFIEEHQDDYQDQDPEDFDPNSGDGDPEGDPMPGEGGEGKPSKAQVKEALEGSGLGEALMGGEDSSEKSSEGEHQDGEKIGGLGDINGTFESDGYRVYSTEKDVIVKKGQPKTTRFGYKEKCPYDIANSTDHHLYEEVKGRLRSNVQVMKTKLKRALLAKQQREWDFGREVGRLDTKRLVSAYRGSSAVYKQRVDRDEEDTAITILCDLSGSMCGEKATTTRDSIVALSECLAGSQYKFKVVGFSNSRNSLRYSESHKGEGQFHRYEPLDTIIFKDFEDPLRSARGSIAQIDDAVGGNNSDYDFIVNEINGLKKRPESRKVLFVLSDGRPACDTDSSSGNYIHHCKKAIKDANRRDGIECIGVGILDSTVERIYDDVVVIQNVDDLSGAMFNKMTKLLVGR